MENVRKRIETAAANDLTLVGLKAAIVAAALVFIVLALVVNNRWALAVILAYIVLP